MQIAYYIRLLTDNSNTPDKFEYRPVEILVGDIYFPQTLISQLVVAIHTTELSRLKKIDNKSFIS